MINFKFKIILEEIYPINNVNGHSTDNSPRENSQQKNSSRLSYNQNIANTNDQGSYNILNKPQIKPKRSYLVVNKSSHTEINSDSPTYEDQNAYNSNLSNQYRYK